MRRRFASETSFDTPAEANVFAHAWCSVIERLTPQQLRHRGQTLLEVWCSAGGEGDVTASEEEWEMMQSHQFPALLRGIAFNHRRE